MNICGGAMLYHYLLHRGKAWDREGMALLFKVLAGNLVLI